MATPSSMIARLRARRGDWRTLIQPRSVAVVIALGGIVVLTFGLSFVGPARDGLPVLSRQPVRLFAGTVAAAREVFSGAGDDAETTEVVTAAGTTPAPGGSPPLRPSDPVATLGDDDERLTVAEVRRLVDDDPSRARELVFLPGVSVGQATEMLDRTPTPAQVPGRPVRPSTSTTTTERPSSTTTTRPRPTPTPDPPPTATSPPTTAPVTTPPATTPPDPTEPEPTVPEPTDPEPTVPEPTIPDPTEPEPTVPEPTVPEPTAPEPTVPEPTVPETVPDTTPPPDEPPIELPDIELPDIGLLDLGL